jgi:hypothetical protein
VYSAKDLKFKSPPLLCIFLVMTSVNIDVSHHHNIHRFIFEFWWQRVNINDMRTGAQPEFFIGAGGGGG